jgi:type I restriction enzyme R subunit
VIVDAVGVTQSLKTDSRPLEKKPGVPLKDLLAAVAVGARDEELFTSLANRLARLDKRITEKEREKFEEKAGGKDIHRVVRDLLNAFNPDILESLQEEAERETKGAAPEKTEEAFGRKREKLRDDAAAVFTGELNEYIDNVRKVHEQKIDLLNPDALVSADWAKDNKEKAGDTVKAFREWIETHRDEFIALQIFFAQPFRRRELTFQMIKDIVERITADKPVLAPLNVWRAFEQLESVSGQPKNEMAALVALIRRATGIDAVLTPYDKTVDANFKRWIFKKHAGAGHKFTAEQMEWLYMLKDQIATSVHVGIDDLDYTPFDAKGGRGRMRKLFGTEMEKLIDELNEVLAG